MKDYIIWLKSGECISGAVDDDTARKIFNKRFCFKKLRFVDMEGIVCVNPRRIEAISINTPTKTNKTGFSGIINC